LRLRHGTIYFLNTIHEVIAQALHECSTAGLSNNNLNIFNCTKNALATITNK